MPAVQPTTPQEVIERILEDIEASVYMGSMYLCLSASQKARLKDRWVKLAEGLQVEHDWANY